MNEMKGEHGAEKEKVEYMYIQRNRKTDNYNNSGNNKFKCFYPFVR